MINNVVIRQVKVWRVCDAGQDQPNSAEVTLSPGDGRLEMVLFHPAASDLVAVASTKGVQVWDITRDSALTGTHTHLSLCEYTTITERT